MQNLAWESGVHPAHRELRSKLLAALPAEELARLRPQLDPLPLAVGQRLIRPEVPSEYAYFVESGMVSLLQTLDDGAAIEVGLIGNEGVVGADIALAPGPVAREAVVTVEGSALRLRASLLKREIEEGTPLGKLALRHVGALFQQICQSSACNGRHSLVERLARWVLIAHRCAENGEIRIRQEFLSTVLGRRRAGVTVAIGQLRAAGLITAAQGRIAILDHEGLEAAACECYRPLAIGNAGPRSAA